jgi:hypothetical protein
VFPGVFQLQPGMFQWWPVVPIHWVRANTIVPEEYKISSIKSLTGI